MTTGGRADFCSNFDFIWVFVLRTPSSSDVPGFLLNQPIIRFEVHDKIYLIFSHYFY